MEIWAKGKRGKSGKICGGGFGALAHGQRTNFRRQNGMRKGAEKLRGKGGRGDQTPATTTARPIQSSLLKPYIGGKLMNMGGKNGKKRRIKKTKWWRLYVWPLAVVLVARRVKTIRWETVHKTNYDFLYVFELEGFFFTCKLKSKKGGRPNT